MPSRSPALRLLALLLLPLLALAHAAPTARADDTPEQQLFEARHLLRVRHEPDAALEIFDGLLAREDLAPRARAEALWGAAECHAARGRWDRALSAWNTLQQDASLPAELRARAEQALQEHASKVAPGTAPGVESREAQEQAERAAQRRQQVAQALDRARAALARRQFDDARREVALALAQDPESSEALLVLGLVESEQPDRGAMLRTLLQFYETVRSESFQRLRARLRQAEEAAQRRRNAGDLPGADLVLREAIALVDRSEFSAQLEAERWNLLFWLRQVAAEARAQQLELAPEPVRPSGPPADAGLRGRFFALLGETFGERAEGGGDPLRFHEFAPQPAAGAPTQRSLGPNAFASARIAVEQGPTDLTRARFAERYVRSTLATDWAPASEARTRPAAAARTPGRGGLGRSAPPRILERLEDVLLVQHGEAVQREVEALRQSFAPQPPPLQVAVAIYAAAAGGTVRLATALRLPSPPARTDALDGVVAGRLLEECRADLEGLPGLALLGTAQLRLDGEVGARLEVTERTEAHPLHASTGEPRLSIAGLDMARYGLWLDLYAEDLPGARGPVRSAAVSVLARARQALPSVVVRKDGPTGPWQRLPKFTQAQVEADQRLAHADTLVLFGLPNPFVDSAASAPDLVLLVGVRPAGREGRPAPVPDVPPWQAGGRDELQEHPLGPLGNEVQDDLVLDGWPSEQAAGSPPPEALAREARDMALATLLATRARLLAGSEANPVRVREGRAAARLPASDHLRLAAAAAWLEAQAGTLLEVETRAYDVPRAAAEAVLAREGLTALPGGEAWLMLPAMLAAADAELAAAADAASLFTLRSTQVARATQQVVARQLASRGITRQVRVLRGREGEAQRVLAVPGLAEEGLVVQVRPAPDEEGRRVTVVRVRAARLRAVESVPVGGLEPQGVSVDVPRWHPLRERASAAPLADGEPLWLRLEHPSDATRVLLVRVVTRRAG
ncbi:MAG: hypothetical protein ACKOSS_04085 [Planctomycetia bacterium]